MLVAALHCGLGAAKVPHAFRADLPALGGVSVDGAHWELVSEMCLQNILQQKGVCVVSSRLPAKNTTRCTAGMKALSSLAPR